MERIKLWPVINTTVKNSVCIAHQYTLIAQPTIPVLQYVSSLKNVLGVAW